MGHCGPQDTKVEGSVPFKLCGHASQSPARCSRKSSMSSSQCILKCLQGFILAAKTLMCIITDPLKGIFLEIGPAKCFLCSYNIL